MRYPQAVNLPFNRSAIGGRFVPAPGGDAPLHGEGYRIIFHGDRVVLGGGGKTVLHEGGVPGWLDPARTRQISLGSLDGRPLLLAMEDEGAALPPDATAEPLLQITFSGRVRDADLSLAGLAQQAALWERKSAFCPRCGGAAEWISGSWGRRCPGCGYEHFPSIYPCAIVLVQRGDEFLLIRKGEWPPGYYSLPSGFCDLGECLEECAAREVMEETGIRIRELRYVGSQCWPFPSQLMAGFTAEFDGGVLAPDPGELEDARWFRRDALPPTFSNRSIAGWIIERHKSP